MSLSKKTAKKVYRFAQRLGEAATAKLDAATYPAHGTRLPPILLFAQPKSGSTFLHRAFRKTLQVPFTRIGAGGVFDAAIRYKELKAFAQGNAVCREHLPARRHLLDSIAGVGIKKVVLHIRDPRYSIVSWTKMVDRFIETRGMPGALLTCEMPMPADYATRPFQDRLAWQVENYLPRQVSWIESWLALAADNPPLDILITKYEEFSGDPKAYIRRVLTFHDVPFKESWIKLPDDSVGKNNIFSEKSADKWADIDPAIKAAAGAQVSAELCRRFDWKQSI
ncbi:MAG: sulfotransferase domain-containing protein [Proteobacteria bacterium]|nr:sulfotransferase domain-containing protein [Pseudomonadota bacterium]